MRNYKLVFGEDRTVGSKNNLANLRRAARYLLLAVAIGLLILLAWGALSGGLQQLPRSHTVGQLAETTLQLIGGLLSLLVILTCFLMQRWARMVRIAWMVTIVTAAALSSVVWGNSPLYTIILFVILALLVLLGIQWALRVSLAK